MNWGVPDWTDENAYPRKLSTREWWWQFTRRRPDYRELWTRFAPSNAMRIDLEWPDLEPLMSPGQTKADLLDRAPTNDPDGLRIRFGISALLNPAKEFSDWYLWQAGTPVAGILDTARQSDAYHTARSLVNEGEAGRPLDRIELAQKRRETLEEEAGIVRVSFDLSKPLRPQMVNAEKLLCTVQDELHGKQNTRKPNRQNWSSYLRILDAKDAGEKHLTIAAVLWPKISSKKAMGRVRDDLKAARKVRDFFPI